MGRFTLLVVVVVTLLPLAAPLITDLQLLLLLLVINICPLKCLPEQSKELGAEEDKEWLPPSFKRTS